MRLVKLKILQNGNLTFVAALLVVITGFLIAYLSLEYLPSRILKVVGLSIGLAFAAIGGFSGRARALDLKPFTNDPLGWRKAKATYSEPTEKTAIESEAGADAEKREP